MPDKNPRKKPSKFPLDPYPAPEVVNIVSELPPSRRGTTGSSIFDTVIDIALKPENVGKWCGIDPKGRSMGGLRAGVRQRLDQLGIDMDISQRGAYVYIRYDADDGGDIRESLEQVRKEARAKYGK